MENLTKKKLCELILRQYGHRELKMPMPVDISKIPTNVIYGSSTIGVCMEVLGMIDDYDDAMYIKNRGGVALISHDENGEPAVISFRDILDSMKE